MSDTIYIKEQAARLEKRGEALLVTSQAEKRYYPLAQLKKIVFQGTFSISYPILYEMGDRNINADFYTYGGKLIGNFIPPENSFSKVRKYQWKTYFDGERRLKLVKNIITVASKNKLTLLKRYYNQDKIEEIAKVISQIEQSVKLLNDDKCKSVNEARGYEGTITRLYFSCFKFMFKKYSFDERNRQPPQDELNTLLSFGYMKIYGEVTRFIHDVGLELYCGFLHEMEGNKPALSCDIAELFKQPIIDSLLLEMVNNDMLNDKHFNKKENICFLNTYGMQVFLRKYEFKMEKTFQIRKIKVYSTYRNAIKLELYKLIKYLFGETDEFEGFRIY